MTISVVQTATIADAWSGSFAANVAAGNTVFLVVTAYSSSGATMSSSSPTFNGSPVTGATQLVSINSGSGSSVYTSIWMLPNVSGGAKTVSVTVSGEDTPPFAGAVGLLAYEVAGLGASPALDKSHTSSATSGTAVTTGASGSITAVPEIVIGSVVIFGQTMPAVGSPWTSTQFANQFSSAGYQIVTSGSSSYTYASTAAASAAWCGGIVTVKGPSGVTVALPVAQAAGAAPQPGTGAGPVALQAAQATGAAPAPSAAVATALHAAQAAGAALPPGVQVGPVSVPLPVAQATAAAPVPSAGASVDIQLPAAAASAAAWPPAAGVAVPLRAAQATGASPGVTPPSRPVTVQGSWSDSYAVGYGFYFPAAAAAAVPVTVTNTEGDWLFALVAWRQPAAGAGATVCVADDAHNWWEPVGSPSADSPAAGVVRTALWAAPAARVADSATGQTVVHVAATGPYLSMAVLVLDVAGLEPWYEVAAIASGYANAASALALSATGPSAQALLFSLTGSDDNAGTVTGPAGWTALTPVTASNGTDHADDITLTPAWQVTASAPSASVTASGTLDLAGVIAGVLVSAPAPAQASPDWPVMITEAAIGAGFQTPPSELTWTDLSARVLSMSMRQGRQYSLAQLSAGQGAVTLDDPDGALIPPGSGPYAGIDSGTPFRRRVIIPAAATPHYVAVSGYFRRWPWSMDAALLRGQVQAETADAWAYMTTPLNSMAVEECLIDDPHGLWPMTDPAGSAAASNLARGNTVPLTQVTSKYGTGTSTAAVATAAFGAASTLTGANSAKVTRSGKSGGSAGMWQQALAGASLAYNGYGFCLAAVDESMPPLAGGVTAEAFAACTLGDALAGIEGNGVFVATASASPAFKTSGSSLPDGMPVYLTAASGFTFPSPFTAGTVYYVANSDGQGNYDLSATQGGSAIACTVSGDGYVNAQLAWDPLILALRDGLGTVAGLSVRNTDGALLLLYRSGAGTAATAVSPAGQDYRFGGPWHFSLACTQVAWRVLVNAGGELTASGTFPAALPASFREATFGGVQDAVSQGYACPGTFGFGAVYPGFSPQNRVVSRYWATSAGMAGEDAYSRVERLLEYAGVAGRRWIGQELDVLERDVTASGRDVGGQPAATGAGNVAASTLPAMLYVAPTGDVSYLPKARAWNQPVRWVLGTDAAAGEIPFQPGIKTDYDPSRVVEDVQLTGLDSQNVTVPAGAASSATMADVTAATGRQYGGQAYQQTGYLLLDYSSQYAAGAGLQDLANWLANVYSKPANRIQSVTVSAFANSANASGWKAWQFWAGVSPGDMVQVNVRVPTAATSPLITLVARVTQTDRKSQYAQGSVSAQVTCALDFAPEYQALTCDDPVRGLLNGSNVMPW